jgi:hypothetical protein
VTLTLALAATMTGMVALPHLIDLRRSSPPVAIALWLSALVMRALLVATCVAYVVMLLPRTALFTALTHWCWHTVLPLLATHLGLNGHRVGDAAVVLPAALLAVSLLSVAAGLLRATRAVRALVRHGRRLPGPDDALVVGGPDIFLAAAGLRRPRVLISAGALVQLDDDELAAGLAHERAHIARRHRWILLVAELARSFGRPLPGTRHARGQLGLHIERDADQWAVRRRHDPLALASVMCKAAVSRLDHSMPVTALAGDGAIEHRLDELAGTTRRVPRRPRVLKAVAVASMLVTLASAVALPAASLSAIQLDTAGAVERHCAT